MLSQFEINILIWIQDNLRCGFLDFMMPVVTYLAEYGILSIVLSLVLISIKKTRKCGFVMAISITVGFIIVNLGIKPLVARVRPYDAYPFYKLLIGAQTDFSFPSGHTLCAFETATSISLYYKKFTLLSVFVACSIAFSRMYLYVHYPSDVLCGALLGITFALIAKKLVEKIYSRNNNI